MFSHIRHNLKKLGSILHHIRYPRRVCRYTQPLPRGFRVAHCVAGRPYYIAYPIGIHLISRWIYRVYMWTLRYHPDRLEVQLQREYDAGYEAGVERGIRIGRERAFTEVPTLSKRTQCVIENSVNRRGFKIPFRSQN